MASRFRGKYFLSIVLRIMTIVAAYTLWCKRNFRLFQRRNRDFGALFRSLYSGLDPKSSFKSVRDFPVNRSLARSGIFLM
jgi:hypothetical protein